MALTRKTEPDRFTKPPSPRAAATLFHFLKPWYHLLTQEREEKKKKKKTHQVMVSKDAHREITTHLLCGSLELGSGKMWPQRGRPCP